MTTLNDLYLRTLLNDLNKDNGDVRIYCFNNGNSIEIQDTAREGLNITVRGYNCTLVSDSEFGYFDVEFELKNDSDLEFDVACENVIVKFDKEFVKALAELTRRTFDFISYNEIDFDERDD